MTPALAETLGAVFVRFLPYECLINDGRDSKEGKGKQKIFDADRCDFVRDDLSKGVGGDDKNPRGEHEPDDAHDDLLAPCFV